MDFQKKAVTSFETPFDGVPFSHFYLGSFFFLNEVSVSTLFFLCLTKRAPKTSTVSNFQEMIRKKELLPLQKGEKCLVVSAMVVGIFRAVPSKLL